MRQRFFRRCPRRSGFRAAAGGGDWPHRRLPAAPQARTGLRLPGQWGAAGGESTMRAWGATRRRRIEPGQCSVPLSVFFGFKSGPCAVPRRGQGASPAAGGTLGSGLHSMTGLRRGRREGRGPPMRQKMTQIPSTVDGRWRRVAGVTCSLEERVRGGIPTTACTCGPGQGLGTAAKGGRSWAPGRLPSRASESRGAAAGRGPRGTASGELGDRPAGRTGHWAGQQEGRLKVCAQERACGRGAGKGRTSSGAGGGKWAAAAAYGGGGTGAYGLDRRTISYIGSQ